MVDGHWQTKDYFAVGILATGIAAAAVATAAATAAAAFPGVIVIIAGIAFVSVRG